MTPEQLAARGVRVKPLGWKSQGKTLIADHGAGHYIVTHDYDGWRWILVNGRDMAGVMKQPVAQPDTAKAAAEADHAARICAALEMMEDGE